MSGVLHKVKNALQAEKNTPEAAAANQGKNEYGHATHATGHSTESGLPSGLEGERKGSQLPGLERGDHTTSSGPKAEIASSSHISPTNPGVLHSTKPGIHGERDSGTSGYHGLESEGTGNSGYNTYDTRVNEETGAGAGVAGLAEREKEKHKNHAGKYTSNTTTTDKHTTTSGTKTSQYPSNNTYGSQQAGSGFSSSGPNTSDPTADLAGAGSGYSGYNRDRGVVDGSAGVTGTGLVASEGSKHSNTTTDSATGSGYNYPSSSNTAHGVSNTNIGSGLTGTDTSQGYGSSTGGGTHGYDASSQELGSGLSGGADSTSASTAPGSGLDVVGGFASGSGSESGSGLGSGYGVSPSATATSTSGGRGGSQGRYSGDGHEEDILHPGPHVTQTAKTLDPHLH